MKSIVILALLVLIYHTGFSQAHRLRIENNTSCNIYVMLYGDEPCGCKDRYSSNLIIVAPGATTFANTTGVGGSFSPSTPKVFTHMRIFSSLPGACVPETVVIGENDPSVGCTYPMSQVFWTTFETACERICTRFRATWINANPRCDGMAIVKIV